MEANTYAAIIIAGLLAIGILTDSISRHKAWRRREKAYREYKGQRKGGVL